MRKDETGEECPETLAEYRAIVVALAGEDNAAVRFLDWKIQEQGSLSKVVVPDAQMRQVLYPLMLQK